MYQSTFDFHDNNMSNAAVALFGGLPTYMFALIGESPMLMMFGAMLTFAFFLLGKVIDVGIKLYFDRRLERKQQNGTKAKDSSTDSRN